MPDRTGQPPLKRAHKPRAFLGILQLRISRRDIARQLRLFDNPFERIFIDRLRKILVHAQHTRGMLQKPRSIGFTQRLLDILRRSQSARRNQPRIVPHRHAILAPVNRIAPPRQAFARVPFALPVMQQRSRRKLAAQQPDQVVGKIRLGRPDRIGIPLTRLVIAIAHERRLAPDRQPHILRQQILVDLIAERHQRVPTRLGKRPRNPHRLGNPRHVHFEMELGMHRLHHHALDRRSRAIMRRSAQGNMPLARKQTPGRIKPQPTRTRHKHFGPRVQIADILRNPGRPIDRGHIRRQLNRIPRDKPRGKTKPAQQLHQQPGRIPARPTTDLERFLRRIHARFQPNDIVDRFIDRLVDRHKKVDRTLFDITKPLIQRIEPRPLALELEIRGQVDRQSRIIGKRIFLRRILDKEIERIDHRQLGQQIDLDREMVDRLGKHHPRLPIAVRILLPVDEVVRRTDRQRIIGHRRPTVRRRPKPDDLRPQLDRFVVGIAGEVMQGCLDHARLCAIPGGAATAPACFAATFVAIGAKITV